MSCDPEWLDKAIRIVEKQIHEMNKSKGARKAIGNTTRPRMMAMAFITTLSLSLFVAHSIAA